MTVVTVKMAGQPEAADAVALIVPLGIDTELHRFEAFEPPAGCDVSVIAEEKTGQMAAVLVPPRRDKPITLSHVFAEPGSALDEAAYVPETSPLTVAAPELAAAARDIAERAGLGLAGLAAIVADTNSRFEYGQVPMTERWYYGTDAVPIVACTAGNCVDINTYLVAALRAAGYEAAYITCYFIPDIPEPSRGVIAGMHCWVRTRCQGIVQDWDIAHFKKAGRADVTPMLNPIPGQRVALAFGRDHTFRWRGLDIKLSTASRPMWVMPNGTTMWPSPPHVTISP